MGVSENSGTPKSSILIGFALINHPFWSTIIFGNTHIEFHEFYGAIGPVTTKWYQAEDRPWSISPPVTAVTFRAPEDWLAVYRESYSPTNGIIGNYTTQLLKDFNKPL